MNKLFKWFYFATIIAQIFIRAPIDRERRKIPKVDQRVTAGEQALFAGLSLGGLFLPLIYSLTGWLKFADYRLSKSAKIRLGGFGIMVLEAALWLFWRAHQDLGTNWSPSLEINTQQTLVTQGIYSKIRHPMYTSQLLWGIGQTMLLQNWIAGWGGLVVFLALYLIRAPKEERMMLDHFGEAYREYSAQTGRILPKL